MPDMKNGAEPMNLLSNEYLIQLVFSQDLSNNQNNRRNIDTANFSKIINQTAAIITHVTWSLIFQA